MKRIQLAQTDLWVMGRASPHLLVNLAETARPGFHFA